jgi:hypothetical protein
MSHVGVERLGSGNGEDYSAEENEREAPMLEEKIETVPWIRRGEDLWGLQNLTQAECSDHREPDDHHGTEYSPDFRGAVLLEEEERREYHHGQREHEMLGLWSYHFQAFNGAQH